MASAVSLIQYWKACTMVIDRTHPVKMLNDTITMTTAARTQRPGGLQEVRGGPRLGPVEPREHGHCGNQDHRSDGHDECSQLGHVGAQFSTISAKSCSLRSAPRL